VVDGKTFTLKFSYAISFKGANGLVKDIRLDASTYVMKKLKNGTWIPSTPVTITPTVINTTISKWEYAVNGGEFSLTPPIGVTISNNIVSINPQSAIVYDIYSIRVSDGTISDTVTIIRNYEAQDGAVGAEGVTLLLSNEAHTFAGSATAALAGSVNTVVLAYKGTQTLTPTSVTVDTAYLPTGMTRAINGSVITFTVSTSMTSANGVIPITVVVDGKTFTLQFSYAIAFKGPDGISKGIYLNTSTQVIKYNEAGSPTPATNFEVVGTTLGTTITTWKYSVNGGNFTTTPPAGVSRTGNTVTISPTTVTFNTLAISASDGTITDTISIVAVRDGSNGLPGKLPIQMEWKQGDTHYNNDTVVSYVYYRSGNTWWKLKDAYTSRVADAAPSETYYQQLSSVEQLVTKVIIAEEGNIGGMIFKGGKQISQKGMINGVESTDYSNPAFVPYVYIDGQNGEIFANKLLNPFVIADPDIAGDLQTKLTNNHNIYLEASGSITYDWKTHYLPGNGTAADKRLDGFNLKIYAPNGCNKRVKILPAHSSAQIFTDDMGNSISAIKIALGTRERIHLSAVWDRVNQVLDWVVTFRSSYQLGTNQAGTPAEIRKPNVFKEGDIIVKADVSSSGVLSNIVNRYRMDVSCSVSSNKYTITLPLDQYYSVSGTLLDRVLSAQMVDIDIIPRFSSFHNIFVYKRYSTSPSKGVHFDVSFRTNTGTSDVTRDFSFIIRAADYIINNVYLDNTI
jgi:hypothetical protein